MKIDFRVIPLLALLATLCAVQPASADFLYDVQTNFSNLQTHEQFTEPAILTSSTTVTSFLLNTSAGATVTTLVLDPVASGLCLISGTGINGPCLGFGFSGANPYFVGSLPVYTSVGTFTYPGGYATITISPYAASTPEPSSILLLATMLGGVVFALKKRLRTRLSPSPAAVG